jgi:hypothetical protein
MGKGGQMTQLVERLLEESLAEEVGVAGGVVGEETGGTHDGPGATDRRRAEDEGAARGVEMRRGQGERPFVGRAVAERRTEDREPVEHLIGGNAAGPRGGAERLLPLDPDANPEAALQRRPEPDHQLGVGVGRSQGTEEERAGAHSAIP